MTYESTTTLNRIRDASPCEDGWTKLLKNLGKTKADDEPLSLLIVLDSNGLEDALWVLSYAMPDDRLARHFQAWCADQVLHIFEAKRPHDTRVRDQIAMLRNDDATDEERVAAADAAWAAAGDAAWAAAGDASGEAAGVAAWDAAGVAAGDAAGDAAWAAAGVAAWDAAGVAAWDAAGDDAGDDAGVAARVAQERQLRAMIGETND